MNQIRNLAAVVAVGGLLLSACSDGDVGGNAEDGGADSGAATAKGGTLKLAGPEEIGNLDPAAAYGPADLHMQRAINRGLLGYLATQDKEQSIAVQADVATEVPTEANGGVSADGLTYTFTIRPGVAWNAPSGKRNVVAGDVVRGVKRICNPKQGSPVIGYFTDTIAGLESYCESFAGVAPTVEAMKAYMAVHEISGVQAPDDSTVVFTLTQPASDFLALVALGSFLAPQPEEYLEYIPDSPELRQNTVSSGPYEITEYVPGQSFTLGRNPAWEPDSDPLRKAYVDAVEITAGQDNAAISQQIRAGTVDMQWGDASTPTAEIPALVAAKDPRLVIGGGGTLLPYLTFNFMSPNNGGAFNKLEVRQAFNYAVNKAAVIQSLGGSDVAKVTGQILPPEILGYQETNPYQTEGDKGDPEKAKQLLAAAGFPNGLTVKMPFREDGAYPNIATVLQQDLAKVGITLELQSMSRNTFYQEYLQNPDASMRGEWDVAPVGWTPDYLGNAARGFFKPLLDGRIFSKGSPNYGNYNNDELNVAIDSALATSDPAVAAQRWAEADVIASKDAAWVPIGRTLFSTVHGDRVQNFVFVAGWHNGDMTNVGVEG